MILVVLGTWRMSFTRPLTEIENLIKEGVINEKVIVQAGSTIYDSKLMEIKPFFEPVELENLYVEARIVICQAGIGSIMLGLKNNKKVIVIARKQALDEHIDDHQEDILDLFSKQNFVLKWNGNNDLKGLLDNIPSFEPDQYPFNEEKISFEIINYINSNIKQRK